MLQELMENAIDYDALWNELGEYAELVESIIGTDVQGELDNVIRQMEAAKRGLGIVNKLEPGEYRAKHASRVMGNMNRIRAQIKHIQKAMNLQADLQTGK